MFKTDIIIFDLEYGDQPVAYSRHGMPSILELGALRVTKNGEPAGKYSSLVYPLHWEDYTPKIEAITQIDKSELEIAPKWTEVYDEFADFARKTTIASWSAIDPVLLRYQCGYTGCDFRHSNRHLDLATVWQETYAEQNSPWSLSAVCKRLHLTPPGHRALDDCQKTLQVFHALREQEVNDAEVDEEFELYEF